MPNKKMKEEEEERAGGRITFTDASSQVSFVGTCQNLEKSYFRLTEAPNPATVRPLAVLRKTLKMLEAKAKDGASYSYLCDQYKSLRQDLTVQHIRNDFTVKAYENHARLALLNVSFFWEGEIESVLDYHHCC